MTVLDEVIKMYDYYGIKEYLLVNEVRLGRNVLEDTFKSKLVQILRSYKDRIQSEENANPKLSYYERDALVEAGIVAKYLGEDSWDHFVLSLNAFKAINELFDEQ